MEDKIIDIMWMSRSKKNSASHYNGVISKYRKLNLIEQINNLFFMLIDSYQLICYHKPMT